MLVVCSALVSCGGSGGPRHVVLDGRPRYPDAEGVVTSVSRSRITLDGGRTYKVSADLESFSTYDLQPISLFQRDKQYVQIGVHGGAVTWLAGIGAVVRIPGQAPFVSYVGRLKAIDSDHRAIFFDGTVLRLAAGVQATPGGGPGRVLIDPDRHVVRTVEVP